VTAPAADQVTPLEMARVWAGRVGQIADHYAKRDEAEPGFGRIEARIEGAGRQQFEAAQMASFMATVSIAEDLHRIVGIMTGQEWDYQGESGAISEARATREHMSRWTAGEDTHPGEAP
jgi:hypothetical protein